jgi:hypothetical protein
MKSIAFAVIALALSGGAALAQYTMYPYGQGSAIIMPPAFNGTGGYGHDVNPGPTFIIPNYQPQQPVQQNWRQFAPGCAVTRC